jgi:hypothetical protein
MAPPYGSKPDHFVDLLQEKVLEEACYTAGSIGSRETGLGNSLASVSRRNWEAFTRQKMIDLNLTGKTGPEIAETLRGLENSTPATAKAWPLSKQVSSLEIRSGNQSNDFRDFVPDGGKDGERRALVARLMIVRTLGDAHSLALARKAEDDIGYAYNQRNLIDGPVMVISMLCPNLARLVVDLGSTTNHSPPFYQLLQRLLEADESAGIERWPGLQYLEITQNDDAAVTTIPPSVHELVLHTDPNPSSTAANPNILRVSRVGALTHSGLQRLKIDGGQQAGNLVGMVSTLVATGTVPALAYIHIEEVELDTAATETLLTTCQTHLSGVLQEFIVDLCYRADDHLNEAGLNDHLQGVLPLNARIFRHFQVLHTVGISRFLLPTQLNLGPYLKSTIITDFRILGAFAEEVLTIAEEGQLRAPAWWEGSLIFGVDYDLAAGTDLVEHAATLGNAISIVQRGFNDSGKAEMKFTLRAIGDSSRTSVLYPT